MLGSFLSVFDPRKSLAARISWVFAALSIISSLLVGIYISSIVQNIVEREIGTLYSDRAQHVVDAVDLKIQALFDTLEMAASVFSTSSEGGSRVATEELIAAAKSKLDNAAWVGVVDRSGVVISDDGNHLKGAYVGENAWFEAATSGDFVSGAQEFTALDQALNRINSRSKQRYLFITVPVKQSHGTIAAYVAAAFDMDLIESIVLKSTKTLAGNRPIDVFLIDQSGRGLTRNRDGVASLDTISMNRLLTTIGTKTSIEHSGTFATTHYLIGYSNGHGVTDFKATGWIAVLRESKSSAYLPAYNLAVIISLACLVMGLAITAASAFGIRYILSGLSRIAQSAEQLKLGKTQEFIASHGDDEVSRISVSLAGLFNSQKRANEDLAELNKNLDQIIVERTREVQRLSEETRIAAITRDRLRLSRDLHDTLAHSMLAMLTQIRLIQKFHKAKPELVLEELAYAETAAQEGLNLARDAVIELRYFAVRDDGLKSALQKLVAKLKERMEVEVTFEIDDLAADLAGPKAETTFRIAEEALHNIEKHSNATTVNLSVGLDRGDRAIQILSLTVVDNGQGFDPTSPKPGHFGLLGMREQAEILNGKLSIKSAKGEGTRLVFEVIL